jgi:hypothetical protein
MGSTPTLGSKIKRENLAFVGFLHQQTVEYEAALRLINKCSVNNS